MERSRSERDHGSENDTSDCKTAACRRRRRNGLHRNNPQRVWAGGKFPFEVGDSTQRVDGAAVRFRGRDDHSPDLRRGRMWIALAQQGGRAADHRSGEARPGERLDNAALTGLARRPPRCARRECPADRSWRSD